MNLPPAAPAKPRSYGIMLSLSLAAAALVPGCGWPRYSNLPDDSDVLDAADDPRATVQVSWDSRTEVELAPEGADNADPREVIVVPLAAMEGLEVTGDLRGAGWNATFDAPPLEGEGCTTASRDPGREGDWAGDVDFAVIEVTGPDLVLCADVAFEQDDLGWDLLLYPLDDANCDLPGQPVAQPDGSGPLGFERGGSAGGWKIPVTAGQRYGVLLASYSAPEAVAEYPYALGLSLVPADDRGTELCPRLPSQGAR